MLPEFYELSPANFAAAKTAIILNDLPPEWLGSPTAVRLMHLNRLFTYEKRIDWSSCLSLHASFLQSVETGQSSWDSWAVVGGWHDHHLDHVKLLPKPEKHPKSEDKPKRDEKICGVDVSFMRDSKLCIKFQNNTCDLKNGHTTVSGKTALSHYCAYCLNKSKTQVEHSAQSCHERAKLFSSGGGRGRSST